MIDYHLHTALCNHAKGTMEAYIQRAINIGLREICFLDHLTVSKFEKRHSMTPGEVPFYFQAVQLLKQRYNDVINIRTGLEIDFNPAYIDLFEDIVGTYSFDVIGSSLHFLDDINIASRSSAWRHGKIDTDYLYALYLEQFDRMLNYNYFDIVCHLDVIKKFGWKPSMSFDNEFNRILSKIKIKDLVVELNTSGYNHPIKEAYPSLNIMKKCRRAEICITLGSDAHNPEDVGQHYDRAFSLLLSAGYSHLTTFKERKRATVSILNGH